MTPLIIVVPGVICALAYPGTDWGSGDSAYPMLVAQVMPKPILGFFAAVMFGAILSSFNSVLNSASTIYALDIHRPLFNPTASDARMVKIGQNWLYCRSSSFHHHVPRSCSTWAASRAS